jgi:hypothetical protein
MYALGFFLLNLLTINEKVALEKCEEKSGFASRIEKV